MFPISTKTDVFEKSKPVTVDDESEKFDFVEKCTSPPLGTEPETAIPAQPRNKKIRWNSFFGKFVLISYIVGLGNLVSFPAMFLNNGRLAFLIPISMAYFFIGIPVLLLEVIIGQFSSSSPYSIFGKVAPLLSSVGGTMTMVTVWRTIFFFPFMAQILNLGFSFLNFRFFLNNCDPENSYCIDIRKILKCEKYFLNNFIFYKIKNEICKDLFGKLFLKPMTTIVTPNFDYGIREIFRNTYIIEESNSSNFEYFPGPEGVLWSLVLLWTAVGVFVFFGIRIFASFGAIFTILPFVIYITCFFFVITHENNFKHLSLLFGSDWAQLSNIKTWSDAVSYTLFSLSLCDGGVVNIASHNSFNNNLLLDLILAVLADIFMSFVLTATFVVSSAWIASHVSPFGDVLGTMSMLPSEAYQLFAFPEFASTRPGGVLFCVLFYFGILLLGLPSMVISTEMVFSVICDKFNFEKKWKKILIFLLCGILGSLSIFMTTPGGLYLMRIMLDDSWTVLSIIALLEVSTFVFKYGVRNFSRDIESMLGYRSPIIRYAELVSWRFVTPTALVIAIGCRFYYTMNDVMILDYIVPLKMKVIGWSMSVTVILFVLAYFGIKILWLMSQGRSPIASLGAHDNWKADDEGEKDEFRKTQSDGETFLNRLLGFRSGKSVGQISVSGRTAGRISSGSTGRASEGPTGILSNE